MSTKRFKIRVMNRREVDLALDWAASEGWNPGLYDGDSFFAADPKGFLIGLLGKEPVAMVSAVKYSDSFGFMGFYIVKPEYRGMGYGAQIGEAALLYLKGCTVGLDGVVAQQENYCRSGFKMAYRNIRYEGVAVGSYPIDSRVVPLSSIPFDDLCVYDQLFFPANRRAFLQSWVNRSQSTALGIILDGKIAGYGVIRICQSGYKVGPLFADDPEYADLLFRALIAVVPDGSPVFLDSPAVNPAAIALAERYHMKMVFETGRMYLGAIPKLPLSRLYGITSFELG